MGLLLEIEPLSARLFLPAAVYRACSAVSYWVTRRCTNFFLASGWEYIECSTVYEEYDPARKRTILALVWCTVKHEIEKLEQLDREKSPLSSFQYSSRLYDLYSVN